VKFVVGDLRVMPLIKKSHVVYCKFPSLFEKTLKWQGVGGMGPIDLAKDRVTWYVVSSLSYNSW